MKRQILTIYLLQDRPRDILHIPASGGEQDVFHIPLRGGRRLQELPSQGDISAADQEPDLSLRIKLPIGRRRCGRVIIYHAVHRIRPRPHIVHQSKLPILPQRRQIAVRDIIAVHQDDIARSGRHVPPEPQLRFHVPVIRSQDTAPKSPLLRQPRRLSIGAYEADILTASLPGRQLLRDRQAAHQVSHSDSGISVRAYQQHPQSPVQILSEIHQVPAHGRSQNRVPGDPLSQYVLIVHGVEPVCRSHAP